MTAVPKQMRPVSLDLLREVAAKPCAVCGCIGPNDPHHIRSRGAGGGDTPENLISLCRSHHNEIHQTGDTTFTCKYPHVLVQIRASKGRKTFDR